MMSALSLIVPSGQLALGESARRDPPLGVGQRSTDTLYGVADLHALTAEHGRRLVRAITPDRELIYPPVQETWDAALKGSR